MYVRARGSAAGPVGNVAPLAGAFCRSSAGNGDELKRVPRQPPRVEQQSHKQTAEIAETEALARRAHDR